MSNELIVKRDELISISTDSIKPLLNDNTKLNLYIKALELAISENPKLIHCTTKSIQACMLKSVITTLIPGKILNEAFFIPYGNKATFIPGVRGIERLIYDTGFYSFVVSQTVDNLDKFKPPHMTNKGMVVEYEQCESKGELIGAFATVWTREGYIMTEYMNLDQLYQAVKKGNAGGKSVPLVKGITLNQIKALGGAYKDFPDEMIRNRVTARLAKRLRKTNQLANAIQSIYEVPTESTEYTTEKTTAKDLLND